MNIDSRRREAAGWITAALLGGAAIIGFVPTVAQATAGFGGLGNLVFQVVVVTLGAALWRVRDQRVNAAHLIFAALAVGAGALIYDPWGQHGYWLQIGFSSEWLVAPLMLRVLLSYP